MNTQSFQLTALRLSQPIGDLFVGTISSDRLASLAKSDIRRITSRELEKMSGIQRGLNSTRVADIAKYIETVDASFPNAFILNLNSEFLNSAPQEQQSACGDGTSIFCFDIAPNERTFSIIDGQHRLSGFQKADVEIFDLIIAFFVDLPIEDQAYLFSTINVTQQKVNKSLVYDLFDVSESRSPQRTAHLITKALNTDEDSPLHRRIKLLGIAPKFEDEVLYKAPLSQGTVAQRIVEAISTDPMSDRDTIRRGNKITLSDDYIEKGLIFRKFFAEEKDWAMLRIMKNYFRAVAEAFPDLWERQDNPLSKTIGYGALMRLLVDAFSAGSKNNDLSFDYFSGLLAKVKEKSDQDKDRPLTFESFPAAGSGESKLYVKLKEWAELA